jgi:Derlin-2/3
MEFFWELPPITRAYLVLCSLASLSTALDVVNPFHLYFNPRLIAGGQWWRLVTNFCYFGDSALDFFMHMAFLLRYAKGLEEGYVGRWWDFAFCIAACAGAMVALASYFPSIVFFGPSLTFMLVYLWSRRNPGMQINLFFLFTFTAPYLPLVLMGISVLLGHSVTRDALGFVVGHAYYYLEDVWPALARARGWSAGSILPSPSNVAALWQRCCAARARAGRGQQQQQQPPPPQQPQVELVNQ